MQLFNVTVYIVTTARPPAKGQAAGAWLVEYITGKGKPEIRKGALYRWETTETALTLELIRDAFCTLAKPCSVSVNTWCEHVLSAVGKRWIKQWEEDGWKNAKGKPVKNAELWQQATGKMKNHCVSFDSRMPPAEYLEIMQKKMDKALNEALKEKRAQGQQMNMFK
ncbi:RNase H family protein [Parablautia muri]|uniref:RNase H type-1 domain-containing protein n=1 Tax=Parablautia muri TaxID=2320879 RepID=A0A9X5BG81_9FIRM|nr:RNase H family protein [Parablautia muri]NBJ93228.1 hypothetical protein [Parablautia muri]